MKKWTEIARPSQLPPEGDWNVWLILAGRGFGKTRCAAETVLQWVREKKFKRIALIANTIQEARQVMVEGESGLLSIADRYELAEYLPSRRLLKWKNGAIATLYGAENYEQLRGPQFDAAWVDEFAKFLHPRETFEQLSFSLRLGKHPKTILTTTPRPLQFIKDLMARQDVAVTRGNSFENIENLSPNFRKQLEFLRGTRLESQEIYAEIVEDITGTLWAWSDIENCYQTPPHFMNNIVIGVDPALTSNDYSDETGIIVAGMDGGGKAYVLDDLSMASASPEQWARCVAQTYHRYGARAVVVEINAGGELITNLLKNADTKMKIIPVRATQSKLTRAEPIAILYQKKMIFHARQFQKLELQMATYNAKGQSPDRMDAMIWAMSELFSIKQSASPSILSI